MTKIILIILSLTIIVSCSTQAVDKDINSDNQNIVLVSDTDLTFQTKKQKIRFLINDSGEIQMLKIYGDKNPQVIHFYNNGYISELTNKCNKEEENVFYFEPTGQLYKMKSFDSACANGGDQFIWFANSTSKSLLSYVITNLLGVVIKKGSIQNKAEVNLSAESKGMYFVSVINTQTNIQNKQTIVIQ